MDWLNSPGKDDDPLPNYSWVCKDNKMNAKQNDARGEDHAPIGPNDVLITNSLVIQASTAVAASSQFDAGYFFDLSSLIEAVILHDHLLYIHSPLNDHYATQPLRQLLISEDILKEYTPSTSAKDIKGEIVRIFSKGNRDFPFGWFQDQQSIVAELDNNELLPYLYGVSAEDHSIQLSDPVAAANFSQFSNIIHDLNIDTNDPQDSLRIYFAGLLRQWDTTAWRGGNPKPALAFLLRTLVYLTVSDQFGVSIYPDLLRVPIILQVTNELHRSLTQEAYNKIAHGFSTNIEELKKSNAPFRVAIPPLTALVLDKSSSPEDIGPVMLDFREHFSNLRATYRQYEHTIRNAKTLKIIQQARRELVEVNSRLAKMYDFQDGRLIQDTASYLEKAIRVGTNPLSPTDYSADLIFKPVGWIKEWWIKRRAIHLFEIKTKLDHLQEYGQLIQKVFGVDLEDDFAVYEVYQNKMNSLYFGGE